MKPVSRPFMGLGLCLTLGTSSGMALAADQDVLNLICFGQGTKLGSEFHSSLVWDKDAKRYRSTDSIDNVAKVIDTAVTIQISGDTGRIQLPGKLLPDLHSGGDGQNWWTLGELSVTADQIRATYKLNALNHPKVVIDRRTGLVTMKGVNVDFSGRCDAIDPGARRF